MSRPFPSSFAAILVVVVAGMILAEVAHSFPSPGEDHQQKDEAEGFIIVAVANNTWDTVDCHRDLLAFSNGNRTVKKLDKKRDPREFSVVHTNLAFTPPPSNVTRFIFYYEAKIVQKGDGILLGLSTNHFLEGKQYFIDARKFAEGTIVGCGLEVEIAGDVRHRVMFFTLDGQVIEKSGGGKFAGREDVIQPFVLLFGNGGQLEANFGATPFKYNLDHNAIKFNGGEGKA